MNHFRLFIFVLSLSGATTLFAADKPNVLFIAIDDLRPSLGCYGASDVVTPNIDKLAAQGVQFNRAYAQVATCGASRASLFSGLSPKKDRFTNYRSRADEDAPGIATLPQVFKENGYTTISLGKILHDPTDSTTLSWSELPFRAGKRAGWMKERMSMTSLMPTARF